MRLEGVQSVLQSLARLSKRPIGFVANDHPCPHEFQNEESGQDNADQDTYQNSDNHCELYLRILLSQKKDTRTPKKC